MKAKSSSNACAIRGVVYAGALSGLLACLSPVHVAAKALTDRSIADAVENEINYDPAVWPESIRVTSEQGVVSLNGVTDNLLEKERATKIARTVKGVRSVVNDIVVRPTISKTGKELKKDVVERLAADPATDSYEISVTADNAGKVTLSGTVQSWQEKNLAEIVAKGTLGVTKIDDRIAVAPIKGTARPDSKIKAEIEQGLFWDVLVDSGLIKVSVHDGEVKLTGTVGSASERYRARHLAYVNGVSDVDVSALKVQDWAADPHRQNPDYAVKSDDDIRKAVAAALRLDPRVASFHVEPNVDGGKVTLRGSVDNLAAKRSAEQDARNTVGVFRVQNRLKVEPQTDVSDILLKRRLRMAFLNDPYIAGYKITVSVDHGIAKLYGTVDTYFEKSRADDVADRINGLSGVRNELTVRNVHRPMVYDPYLDNYPPYKYSWYDYRPAPSYKSDEDIREDIKNELWWSPFVDADEVKVSVVNGRATLTGTVDSPSEWQAASENAWEGGANWVVNDLRIRRSTGAG